MCAGKDAALLLCVAVAAVLLPHTVGGGSEAEILQALDEAAAEGSWGYVPLSGPYIDEQHSGNVTARVGSTAVLNCRILYIVGKPVSWMRTRDLHLLTVGRFTYTSDDRFKAVHQSGSQDWLLKIHYVQERDSGQYECQVATTPPITRPIWLSVVEPETVVLGGPDLYINAGSAINLTCLVKFSPKPPPFILWYHGNDVLNYDQGRNDGVRISVWSKQESESAVSRLLIQPAMSGDSGLYTCSPANAKGHTLTVHVINSDKPAAIHHKNTTNSSSESGAVGVKERGPTGGAGTYTPQYTFIVLLSLIPLLFEWGGGEFGEWGGREFGRGQKVKCMGDGSELKMKEDEFMKMSGQEIIAKENELKMSENELIENEYKLKLGNF